MINVIADSKNKQVEFKLSNIKFNMLKYIRSALFEIGAENTQLIKKYIYRPPKTGRIYSYRGRPHQASAPGESPANRSGLLARSVTYHVHMSVEVELIASAKYANWLEDGTSKMLPRPYFIRAINAKRRDNLRSFERHVYNNLMK